MSNNSNDNLLAIFQLDHIVESSGYANKVELPSDAMLPQLLLVVEDGYVISSWTDEISRVESEGAGLFHADGRDLYFSTKDNSDPASNGKDYILMLLPNVLSNALSSQGPAKTAFNQRLLSSCVSTSNPVIWSNELISSFWSDVSNSPMGEFNFSKLNGKRLIDIVRNHLPSGGTCLDFGAGDGDLVRELISQGFQCGAYEISNGRASHISELVDNDKFLGLYSENKGEQFDVVFLLDVIEHILPETLGSALDLLLSFVKPGGIVIVSTPNEENLKNNYCVCPVCRHNFHRWQHLRSIDAGYLEGLFRKWGCEKLSTHRVDFSHNISDAEVRSLVSPPEIVVGDNKDVEGAIRAVGSSDFRFGSQSHLIYIGKKTSISG